MKRLQASCKRQEFLKYVSLLRETHLATKPPHQCTCIPPYLHSDNTNRSCLANSLIERLSGRAKISSRWNGPRPPLTVKNSWRMRDYLERHICKTMLVAALGACSTTAWISPVLTWLRNLPEMFWLQQEIDLWVSLAEGHCKLLSLSPTMERVACLEESTTCKQHNVWTPPTSS